MRLSIDARLDYWLAAPADLLFALEVAQTPDQRLVTDLLSIGGVDPLRPIAADNGLGRRTWTRGEGRVTAHYTATVEVDRAGATLHGLTADDVKLLPADVVPFLFPSRYCEADRFDAVVRREFGALSGGDRVEAMAAWIRGHLDYVVGSSDATTTAADIPARMVAAYAWRLDPPDFHAVVEVWLDGEWRLIDPTGLAPVEGLVRIGVGRDATDISFLTIFGEAECLSQTVTVERVD